MVVAAKVVVAAAAVQRDPSTAKRAWLALLLLRHCGSASSLRLPPWFGFRKWQNITCHFQIRNVRCTGLVKHEKCVKTTEWIRDSCDLRSSTTTKTANSVVVGEIEDKVGLFCFLRLNNKTMQPKDRREASSIEDFSRGEIVSGSLQEIYRY
jgi:hypothetical protein